MKKVLCCMVLCIVATVVAMSQERQIQEGQTVATGNAVATLPLTVRSGNTYTVGNELMKPRQYGDYLRNTCPQAFAKFNTGMKMSHAGWGLFASGLALSTTGVIMGFCHPVKDEVLPYHHAMNALFYTGTVLFTASVPVLIVGYCKQHNAANMYNSYAQPYVSLNVGNNGVGLAYNF